MKINIFEFSDYKAYLNALAGGKNQRTGFKSELAEALDTHTSFISKCLGGNLHLSLEQAEKASWFLNHTDAESHFFLLLVNFSRAGTKRLRDYFKKQIEREVEQNFNIKKRVGVIDFLDSQNQSVYYSSPWYAAIHMALTIDSLQTPEVIGNYFNIKIKKVTQILEFLTSVGLARLENGRYSIGPTQLHLGRESQYLLKHHINWRTQAIGLIDNQSDDLNYSAVVTLAQEDVKKIKEILVSSINKSLKIVHDSPAEDVYCLGIDLMSLRR